MFEAGGTCICQCEDWYNAFGEKTVMVPVGTRLKVQNTRRIHGITCLEFAEYPDLLFYSIGFKPMRALN